LEVKIMRPSGDRYSSDWSDRLQPFSIRHLTQLQSFSCGTVYGVKQLLQLRNLTQLTRLSLEWEQDGAELPEPEGPDAACWVPGPNLQNLQELHLIACPDGDAVVNALPRSLASSLTSLTLELCDLTDGVMPVLAMLTALKSLQLKDNDRMTELPATFASLTGLTKLTLEGSSIGNKSLVPLQKLQQLELLKVLDCAFSKQGLQALRDKLPRLVSRH
jgi:hypothetical protein